MASFSEIAPSQQDEGIFNRSVRSGKWFLLNVFAQKVIQFGTFFILARLLDPRDYGVIGIMLVLHGLLDQFTNPSFGQAFTREKTSIEQVLDPYWSFEIIRYTILFLFLFLAAAPLGNFFHLDSSEIQLLRWSGLLLLIPAVGNVRQMYFIKDLQFQKIFIRDIVTYIAYAIIAIGYAYLFEPSAWALFFGYAASYVVSDVLTYVLYPSRPKWSWHFERLRAYVGYSKWVYGQGVTSVLMAQIDKIFVGRWLNPVALGLYVRGKDLASTTTAIITSLLAKVGFPAFAKVQDEIEKVRRGFIKSIDLLLLASLPITLVLLFEGGSIVSLLFGYKWYGLVVPLKIFAFGNLFIAFVQAVNPVLAALGRPDVNFKTNVLQTLLCIPLMYVGFRFYGLPGLAGAVVFSWIFLLIYVILKVRPVLNIAVKSFLPTITSGIVSIFSVLVVDILGRSTVHAIAHPIVTIGWIALLVIIYYAGMYLSGHDKPQGPWATLVSILESVRLRT